MLPTQRSKSVPTRATIQLSKKLTNSAGNNKNQTRRKRQREVRGLKPRFTQAKQQACLPAIQITTKRSIPRTSQQHFLP